MDKYVHLPGYLKLFKWLQYFVLTMVGLSGHYLGDSGFDPHLFNPHENNSVLYPYLKCIPFLTQAILTVQNVITIDDLYDILVPTQQA